MKKLVLAVICLSTLALADADSDRYEMLKEKYDKKQETSQMREEVRNQNREKRDAAREERLKDKEAKMAEKKDANDEMKAKIQAKKEARRAEKLEEREAHRAEKDKKRKAKLEKRMKERGF